MWSKNFLSLGSFLFNHHVGSMNSIDRLHKSCGPIFSGLNYRPKLQKIFVSHMYYLENDVVELNINPLWRWSFMHGLMLILNTKCRWSPLDMLLLGCTNRHSFLNRLLLRCCHKHHHGAHSYKCSSMTCN